MGQVAINNLDPVSIVSAVAGVAMAERSIGIPSAGSRMGLQAVLVSRIMEAKKKAIQISRVPKPRPATNNAAGR